MIVADIRECASIQISDIHRICSATRQQEGYILSWHLAKKREENCPGKGGKCETEADKQIQANNRDCPVFRCQIEDLSCHTAAGITFVLLNSFKKGLSYYLSVERLFARQCHQQKGYLSCHLAVGRILLPPISRRKDICRAIQLQQGLSCRLAVNTGRLCRPPETCPGERNFIRRATDRDLTYTSCP